MRRLWFCALALTIVIPLIAVMLALTAVSASLAQCEAPLSLAAGPVGGVPAQDVAIFQGAAVRYGLGARYVNRVIADDRLDDEVDAIASRLARFDRDAMARTKSYVDRVTLPPDTEFPPALADFFELLGRPAQQAQSARLEALGLNTDSDLERALGRRVVDSLSGA